MKKKQFSLLATMLLNGLVIMMPTSSQAQIHYYSPPPYYYHNMAVPISAVNQGIKNRGLAKLDALASDNNSTKKSFSTGQSSSSSSALSRAPATDYAARASANNNPLPYNREPALSSKIREEFLADYARQMPDEVAGMRATAERTDIVQVMAGFVQLQGLDSGTMEGIMAFWYGQAWAIVHQKPLPTPQQYQGIADQIRTSISKSPGWINMSNEKRQMFFEQLAYPLFVQKANYQAYLRQGKKDSIARMSAATQEGLRRVGLDLRNLKLSDNGFIG
jgi:hypothetical protein